MEQIFSVYGKFLLEAIAVALLITLLFTGVTDENGNHGVLQIAGASLPVNDMDYSAYRDYAVWVSEAQKDAPVILSRQEGMIQIGNQKLSEYITAVDYGMNRIPVNIVSIETPSGEDVTGDYSRESTEINFTEAGVYIVTVSAVDDGGRRAVKKIALPVNQ